MVHEFFYAASLPHQSEVKPSSVKLCSRCEPPRSYCGGLRKAPQSSPLWMQRKSNDSSRIVGVVLKPSRGVCSGG